MASVTSLLSKAGNVGGGGAGPGRASNPLARRLEDLGTGAVAGPLSPASLVPPPAPNPAPGESPDSVARKFFGNTVEIATSPDAAYDRELALSTEALVNLTGLGAEWRAAIKSFLGDRPTWEITGVIADAFGRIILGEVTPTTRLLASLREGVEEQKLVLRNVRDQDVSRLVMETAIGTDQIEHALREAGAKEVVLKVAIPVGTMFAPPLLEGSILLGTALVAMKLQYGFWSQGGFERLSEWVEQLATLQERAPSVLPAVFQGMLDELEGVIDVAAIPGRVGYKISSEPNLRRAAGRHGIFFSAAIPILERTTELMEQLSGAALSSGADIALHNTPQGPRVIPGIAEPLANLCSAYRRKGSDSEAAFKLLRAASPNDRAELVAHLAECPALDILAAGLKGRFLPAEMVRRILDWWPLELNADGNNQRVPEYLAGLCGRERGHLVAAALCSNGLELLLGEDQARVMRIANSHPAAHVILEKAAEALRESVPDRCELLLRIGESAEWDKDMPKRVTTVTGLSNAMSAAVIEALGDSPLTVESLGRALGSTGRGTRRTPRAEPGAPVRLGPATTWYESLRRAVEHVPADVALLNSARDRLLAQRSDSSALRWLYEAAPDQLIPFCRCVSELADHPRFTELLGHHGLVVALSRKLTTLTPQGLAAEFREVFPSSSDAAASSNSFALLLNWLRSERDPRSNEYLLSAASDLPAAVKMRSGNGVIILGGPWGASTVSSFRDEMRGRRLQIYSAGSAGLRLDTIQPTDVVILVGNQQGAAATNEQVRARAASVGAPVLICPNMSFADVTALTRAILGA